MTPRTIVLFLTLTLTTAAIAQEITCGGDYGGHLQGLATDDNGHIYWSFTVDLVKTDDTGKVLITMPAASHHGDLTYHDGSVYVAVNLGEFNKEPGHEDSWVYVYDAETLECTAKHEVPELVHGAGGIGVKDGRFYVVGGLPHDYTENYVYEYDAEFTFIKRHIVDSGHTNLGIQTACYLDGSWWFGCYEKEKGLLQVNGDFKLIARHDPNHAYGIAPWRGGQWIRGESTRNKLKRWTGSAVVTASIKNDE